MTEDYSTAEMLRAAPAPWPAYKQWCRNGRLDLSSGPNPGTGNRRRHTFEDVVQVAIAAELSRLGIVPVRSRLLWTMYVRPLLAAASRRNVWLFLAQRPDNSDLDVRLVDLDGEADAGMDRPDAPVAFAVLRLAPIIERVEAELSALRGAA